MGSSSDLTDLFASPRNAQALGARVGKVIEWSTGTATYAIEIGGTVITNIAMLANATMTSVRPGDSVMVVRYQDTYVVLGRIVAPGAVQPEPNLSVPMVPQFYSGGTPNTQGVYQIGSATQCDWHGYAKITHPKLFMIAQLGTLSGTTQNCKIEISVGGNIVGELQSTTLDTAVYGPFGISPWILPAPQLIQVRKYATTVGSGQHAFHIYGMYQRSY